MTAVATHIEFCGMRLPRDPIDIARDQWIANRLPVVVASLEQQDKPLSDAFADVNWLTNPAVLDAYRSGDAIEFMRLVRKLVTAELENDAETSVEDEAYARYPEAA